MTEKMSIKDTILLFKRRKNLIAFTAIILFLFCSLVIFYLVAPSYQFSKEILVGGLKQDNSVNGNLQLINSYKDVIKSPIVMETLKKELDLTRSSSELRNQIMVLNNENSQIVSIVVKDQNPNLVRDIATTAALISKEKMKQFTEEDNIQILYESGIDEKASIQYMPTLLSIILSIIISILAGVCFAITIEAFDDKLSHEKQAEDIFNVPVLGYVEPRSEKKETSTTEIFMRRETLDF